MTTYVWAISQFAVLFISMWSMSSGDILIVHISVVQIPLISFRKQRAAHFKGAEHHTFDHTGGLVIIDTSFPLPICSVTD